MGSGAHAVILVQWLKRRTEDAVFMRWVRGAAPK